MSSIIESIWEHFSYLPLKNRLKNKNITLKKWPDFNPSHSKPEYVTIASLLTHKSLSCREIINLTQYEDYMVHSFLNAAYLLDLIEVETIEKNLEIKTFSHRMRQVFGFHP